MKAYIVAPAFATFARADARTSAALTLVADIVFQSLRRGGDTFQYALAWANPGEQPGDVCDMDTAVPHVVKLDTDDALLTWLHRAIDPNDLGGGDVRSIATCRAATFGYDGQALLCLRHNDPPPVSPKPELVVVEERSELIDRTDYFDGLIRNHV